MHLWSFDGDFCAFFQQSFLKVLPENLNDLQSSMLDVRVIQGQDFDACVEEAYFYTIPEIQSWKELGWNPRNVNKPIKMILTNIQLKRNK